MQEVSGLTGYETLVRVLRTWQGRWRVQRAAVWGLRGAIVGLALALILALLSRLFPLFPLSSLLFLSLAVVFLCAAMAFGLALLRPPSLLQTARVVDSRLSLRERLSTALAIHAGQVRTFPALAAAQLADAIRVAEGVESGRAFPWRMSRRELGIALLLVAMLIASFVVPNPMEAVLRERAAVRQALAEQVAELEALRDEIEANQALSEEQREALLQELDELLRDLKEGDLSREEAVARLSEAEQRLMALRREDAAAQQAGLEEAARAWQDSDLTAEMAEALERGDYRAAAEGLAQYATTAGESLSREEELALADELAQAAEALAESNPELAEKLNEAAEALRRGDAEAARQAIAEASEQLAQTGQQIAGQEAVDEALAAVQEGRQAVAQAGEGVGSEGQEAGSRRQEAGGQEQGAGSGEGESAGQEGQAQAGEGVIPQDNPPGQEGESEYESVYAPQRLGEGEGEGEQVMLPGEGEGPYHETPRDVDEEGQALVPYDQVYGDYSRAAAEALESSYIPLGIKEYVREYFSALEP
ncbi:MAG: hypothetical protein H5T62_02970 [Anaerolineae bacterium]|nr:hypothetical protein [Anaerolineae bacterium]